MTIRTDKKSLPRYQWVTADSTHELKHIASFSNKVGIPLLVGQVLYNRGITTADEARSFISPSHKDILPPESVPGLEEAANRLYAAGIARESVLVHGDYDADGIIGSAILHRTLKNLGCKSRVYLPERDVDGFGLSPKAIDSAIKAGIKLIVTVDCGISSHESIKKATDSGIEVIITDHHSLPNVLPKNVLLVHPDLDGEYAGGAICGAAVAYKLSLLLTKYARHDTDEFIRDWLPLVAIATVADVVPLLRENRIFVSEGLNLIPESKLPGMKVLWMGTRSEKTEAVVTARDIAFGIAPLLNAAGRMEGPLAASKLILASSLESAWKAFRHLQKLNTDRKKLQEALCSVLLSRHEIKYPGENPGILVVADESCTPGLAGIVSARLTEQTGRPACVLAPIKNGNGKIYRGSMRASGGENLLELMEPVERFTDAIGGHKGAIGLTVSEEKLDEFVSACSEIEWKFVPPELNIDLHLDSIPDTPDVVETLDKLGPWGAGNPQPVFSWGPVQVKGSRAVGKTGDHLQMELRDNSGTLVKSIGFSMTRLVPQEILNGGTTTVAGHLILNSWNGFTNVEFQLLDLLI